MICTQGPGKSVCLVQLSGCLSGLVCLGSLVQLSGLEASDEVLGKIAKNILDSDDAVAFQLGDFSPA